MQRFTLSRIWLVLTLFAIVVMPAESQPQHSAAANYGNLPLTFEANQGQVDSSVQFLAHGQGYTLFLRPGEALLGLSRAGTASKAKMLLATDKSPAYESSVVELKLVGADTHAKASAENEQITKTNYFLGKDPANWHSNIPNYAQVRYHAIYPGIDMLYYGNQRRLEHDFIVAPGADTTRIVLAVNSGTKTHIDSATGDLVLTTGTGEVRLLKPVTYQTDKDAGATQAGRTEIASSYKLLAGNRIGFSVGEYDHAQPLVIDPVLSYSTYLGGAQNINQVNAITVDSQGEAFVTGATSSTSFPVTSGAFQTTNKANYNGTAFVSKLNADGTGLVYSTFLGGTGLDSGNAIAIDSSGSAYVAGSTASSDFPVTAGAFQTTDKDGATCFVAKLNPLGTSLTYATYLGGSGSSYGLSGDACSSIQVDGSGNAYVAGRTTSADFPVTSGAFQTTDNEGIYPTGFVTKLNSAGTALIYSTYLGGHTNTNAVGTQDSVNGIALDSAGDLFVTGSTGSTTFPVTPGAYQTVNAANSVAFVTELNPTGTSLIYSTLLGATSKPHSTTANGIAIDSAGNAYIAGTTDGLPTTIGAFQGNFNRNEYTSGFVTKLNAAGTELVYSTFLGSTAGSALPPGRGQINGITVDSSGNAYVAGTTDLPLFPVTAAAVQKLNTEGGSTAFVSELNPTGTSLVYSTYLGGSYEFEGGNDTHEGIYSIAFDGSGGVYVGGETEALNFPVSTGAFQTSVSSVSQYGFVTRLELGSILTGAGTTTALSSHSSTSVPVVGLPTSLIAKVTSIGSSAIPTGTVYFTSRGKVVSEETLDSTGKATYTTSNLPATGGFQGATPLTVTANYGGSSMSDFSTGSLQLQNVPVFLDLVSGNQWSTYGTPFSTPLVVQVSDSQFDGNPLKISGVPIAFSGAGLHFSSTSVITDANGQARVTATPTQTGNLTATATEGGSGAVVTFNLQATKAPLYISAKNVAVTYGQAPSAPNAYTLTGFVNGDTASVVSGSAKLTTNVTATTPVGIYPITVSVGSLSAQNYYFSTISNGEGAVQVYKAPLHIKPNSVTIHAGDPLPGFTYTLSGFVNGDMQGTATTGAASLSTTATTPTKPGRYYIIGAQGSLQATNYYFLSYVPDYGILTVLP